MCKYPHVPENSTVWKCGLKAANTCCVYSNSLGNKVRHQVWIVVCCFICQQHKCADRFTEMSLVISYHHFQSMYGIITEKEKRKHIFTVAVVKYGYQLYRRAICIYCDKVWWKVIEGRYTGPWIMRRFYPVKLSMDYISQGASVIGDEPGMAAHLDPAPLL